MRTHVGRHRSGLPRLWGVQVRPGKRGWFDKAMLERLSKDGVNTLTLRISTLGRKRAGKRAFDSVRRFAAAEKLYLIAVLPPGKPHTPAGRHAAATCSKHRFTRLGLRCAVRATSPAEAARLARRHNSVRRLVAVYFKGPRRLSRAVRLRGATRRPIILVAPLDTTFDAAAWGSAIGQTAASASVDLGVAPRSRRASAALVQFGAILANESGAAGADTTPPSTPTGLSVGSITQTAVTLGWDASTDDVGVAGYRLFENGTEVGTATSTAYTFAGLACGTSYTLGVAAYDAAGNISGTATTSRSTTPCSDTQPPSEPTGLTLGGTGSTSALLSWNAGSDNVGVTGYRLYVNGIEVGSSLTTSYLFSGLACDTDYTLGVAAADAAGNVSPVASLIAQTSTCSDTQPPSVPADLVANVGDTSVTLSWAASSDSVGVVGYRLFLDGSQVASSSSTSYSFTGLSCGTAYTFGVAAYDAAGNVSGTATLQRATHACPDTQPPSTPSGLAASSVAQTSVKLSWKASTDNVGVTGYRLFLNGSLLATTTSRSYSFTGLTCGTAYTLGVAAYDAAGNGSATATLSQSTSACPDTQPPSTPLMLATSGDGPSSVTLSWIASTDDVGVTGYRLFVNGTQVGTSISTSYSFTGLACGTSYTLGVAAYDAAGNVSGTATLQYSTSACSDTQGPSTPTGLGTNAVGQTGMTLSWGASTDNVGVTGYRLFLNGNQVGTSGSTSYSFTGLTCGTSYTLGVAAYDAAGNVSATATLSQATSSCPDTQPPSTPAGLAASSVTQTSVKLSWSASTDNVGVTGYRLYSNGTQVGTSSSTSYSFTGLTCGTPYTLGVTAYDAAGNASTIATTAQSTSSCSDTQPPSTPAGLAAGGVSQTAATLSWSASTDNVGVSGYRLFLNGTQVGTSTSTSYSFTSLTCGTSYTLGVAAYDASGNVSGTATLSQATSACPDTQPPSTPAGLAASSVTQTSVKLSWNASTDNVGVTGYRLYSNGTQVGTSSSTSYSFTGLTCGTSYTLGVAAYDAAGNLSARATFTQSTSACPDTQAPSTPTGLGTSSVTQTGATLSWTASTDNVGVTGYRLFLNGTQVGTSTSTSYSFTGLTCGTSYTLGVAAYDAAGNVSGTATAATTTSACSSGGAVVYLSPSGSDGSCVRGDGSHPCATPAKAWSIAQAGDTISVADGTYTSGCALSGDKTAAVTFTGSANAKFACLMTFPAGVANAVVNGISLYQVQGSSANVTLENGALTCTDSAPYTLYQPDNFCSAWLGLSGGASNWLIQNESIGPSYDSESPCGYPANPNISRLADVSNITFKNVLIHDDRYGCSSQHTENMRIDVTGTDTSNITLDGVTFYNGPNSGLHGQGGGPNSADLFMGGPGTLSGLTIQNSVVWGSGTALDGADDLQIQDSVIRDNSFTSSMYFEYPTAPYPSSFKITNNIAPDQGCAIGGSHGSSGGYFSHNLWYYNSSGGSADKCAPSDLSVNGTGVVNTIFNGYAGGDFTLASGSPAIDAGSAVSGEYASIDKNGLARSCGSAPDIGAYERCP